MDIHDVKIPMRDGVELHTRLYVPGSGRLPALLRRTPYPWEWMGAEAFNGPNQSMAERGYVVAVQYVRGRFESEGDFEPFHGDTNDAYDTIDWLIAQSWSDGSVGMYGQSYEASVQLAAVLAAHPALRCVVPQAFGTSFVDGTPYHSPGVLSVGAAIGWAAQIVGEAEAAEAAAASVEEAPAEDADAEEAGNEIYQMYSAATEIGWHEGLLEMTQQFRDALLPVLDERPGRSLEMMGKHASWWTNWLDSDTADAPYWAEVSMTGREDLALPALHVSGWLDPFLQATIDRYSSWKSRGSVPAVRHAQRLVIGPWAHGLSGAQWDGHVQATPEAQLFAHPDIHAFLRRWLHDDKDALSDSPPIRIYVMGDNVWHDEWEWPLARTRWTPLFLSGTGATGGMLTESPPDEDAPDIYDFDPRDPVPAIGGAVLPGLVLPGPGQYDQRPVEDRPDVLTYTADVIESDVEVTGPVSVALWVQSTAVDTDFTAKLVDVFPTGEAVFVCQGIARPTTEMLNGVKLDPSLIYQLRIDLTSTSYVFKAGHAIRLEVSSSCFPVWDVNPNTGDHYATAQTSETAVAQQTIFHDQRRPSHVTLPVIPRGNSA